VNYGPMVFLAAFFAMASSWFAFVLKPQLQTGQMVPTNTVPAGLSYPAARPGLAQQGLQVYRENGCYYCHSKQVMQESTVFEVILIEAGTNPPALQSAIAHLAPKLAESGKALEDLPKPILASVRKDRADRAVRLLTASGAEAIPWVRPTGPDIARGWGKRRSVAEDFLFDDPVMLGSQRVGPDLANVGVRQPDINWHLRHFYAPTVVVPGSVMPPYSYLFEKRRVGLRPSPNALAGGADLGVGPGFEVVPKPEALALAAYMISLRADAPLFSAPYSVPGTLPPPETIAETNAPSANGGAPTNAPSQ
jgi:cbb3-type cytochrome oxidase cytochrome c subunit